MQLAYGLYPDGYLPRMVIVTDGNQTQGDVAVEAYRAKELGVKVSWRTFNQDKTSEVRVVGVHRARGHQGRPAVRRHRRGVVHRAAER